jgi:hypothetical protein
MRENPVKIKYKSISQKLRFINQTPVKWLAAYKISKASINYTQIHTFLDMSSLFPFSSSIHFPFIHKQKREQHEREIGTSTMAMDITYMYEN